MKTVAVSNSHGQIELIFRVDSFRTTQEIEKVVVDVMEENSKPNNYIDNYVAGELYKVLDGSKLKVFPGMELIDVLPHCDDEIIMISIQDVSKYTVFKITYKNRNINNKDELLF